MSKVTMTYSEVQGAFHGLQSIKNESYKGVNFLLAVIKNIKALKAELETVEEAFPKPSEEFVKVEDKMNEVRKRASKHVDQRGNPRTQEDVDVVAKYQSQLNNIQEKNSEVIEERNNVINEFMETETEIEIVSISENDLPEDISGQHLEALMSSGMLSV